jgi:hypothetical protein
VASAVLDRSTVVPRINLALLQFRRNAFAEAMAGFRAAGELIGEGPVLAIAVSIGIAACAAALGDKEVFDERMLTVSRIANKRPECVDRDIALVAERAGDLMAELGEPERAKRAWCVAVAQWEGLALPEEAARTRARLTKWEGA